MNIAKGIKGIKKFLQDNKTGWHIFIGDDAEQYIGYYNLSSKVVLDKFCNEDTQFIGWQGSAMFFKTL